MDLPLGQDELEELAESILLNGMEDVEYLTIWEMVADYLEYELQLPFNREEAEAVVNAVDKLVSSAVVTVEFPNG